eukprot:Pgem_evm1s5928
MAIGSRSESELSGKSKVIKNEIEFMSQDEIRKHLHERYIKISATRVGWLKFTLLYVLSLILFIAPVVYSINLEFYSGIWHTWAVDDEIKHVDSAYDIMIEIPPASRSASQNETITESGVIPEYIINTYNTTEVELWYMAQNEKYQLQYESYYNNPNFKTIFHIFLVLDCVSLVLSICAFAFFMIYRNHPYVIGRNLMFLIIFYTCMLAAFGCLIVHVGFTQLQMLTEGETSHVFTLVSIAMAFLAHLLI